MCAYVSCVCVCLCVCVCVRVRVLVYFICMLDPFESESEVVIELFSKINETNEN